MAQVVLLYETCSSIAKELEEKGVFEGVIDDWKVIEEVTRMMKVIMRSSFDPETKIWKIEGTPRRDTSDIFKQHAECWMNKK
jgi:hypothetical protein